MGGIFNKNFVENGGFWKWAEKKARFHRAWKFREDMDFGGFPRHWGGWLRARFPDICEKYGKLKVLHVDGKAMRAAAEKSKGERPVYHMNAMYEDESIGLEIKRVDEKENAIPFLSEFLGKFNPKDTIMTVDAIECNKTVIDTIHERNGNYVIPVKENQKKLLAAINEEAGRLEEKGKFKELDKAGTLSKKHGRLEKVTMSMINGTSFLYEKLDSGSFYGSIARIGIVDKKVTERKDGEGKNHPEQDSDDYRP